MADKYICSICKETHEGGCNIASLHYCHKCREIKSKVEPLLKGLLEKIIKELRGK